MSAYPPDMRDSAILHIITEVASGRSVHQILKQDDHMPGASTFWRWHMDDDVLRDNLARARINGADALIDEAQAIADEQEIGERVETDASGNVTKKVKEDMLGHRKLRIETRIKRAQMIAPRKYGPKLDLTTDGQKLPGALDTSGMSTEALRELANAKDAIDDLRS